MDKARAPSADQRKHHGSPKDWCGASQAQKFAAAFPQRGCRNALYVHHGYALCRSVARAPDALPSTCRQSATNATMQPSCRTTASEARVQTERRWLHAVAGQRGLPLPPASPFAKGRLRSRGQPALGSGEVACRSSKTARHPLCEPLPGTCSLCSFKQGSFITTPIQPTPPHVALRAHTPALVNRWFDAQPCCLRQRPAGRLQH